MPAQYKCAATLIILIGIFFFQTSYLEAITDGRVEWQKIHLPGPNAGVEQTASLILDIDKDGINDFVIAERRAAPAITWYKKNGATWNKKVIETGQVRIEAGGAFHDIDNDGDLDILFGQDNSGAAMWWWENPHPNHQVTQWIRHELKNTGGNKHHDSMFANVDSDAQIEFITWNQRSTPPNALRIGNIPANPETLWNLPVIYSASTGNEHEGLAIGDIDLDGINDIIGAGMWFKGGPTFPSQNIDTAMRFTRAAVGQLIPGGRPEVVFVCGDCDGPLKWYDWSNNAWQAHTLKANIIHGHSLQVRDIDNDGKLDIFVGEMGITAANPQTYFFYNQGNGQFIERTLPLVQANHESKLGDLDGDGDTDLLAKPYEFQAPGVDIYLNQSSTAPTNTPTPTPTSGGGSGLDDWQTHIIGTRSHTYRSIFVAATDLSGDNKPDIIAGGNWFRNPGAINGAWTRNTIGAGASNFATYYDFDNDGDRDILATNGEHVGSNFVWAQNNGSGTFTIRNNIAPGTGDFLQGVVANRFTSNGPLQVALSWHRTGNPVQMLTVPSNPTTGTWTIASVPGTTQLEDLSSGDIDRDGDQDLLQGSTWLRNNAGTWTQQTLFNTTDHPDRNNLADINQDGKLDAIIGYEAISVAGKVAWYAQGNTPTGLWTETVIANNVIGPMSLDTGDLDGDGDIDVVVGEHNLNSPTTAKAFVFENRNQGTQWVRHQVSQGQEHHDGMQLVDLDNDGDLDIISIGWGHNQIIVYENRNSVTPTPTSTPAPVNFKLLLTRWFTTLSDSNADNIFNIFDWLNRVND